MTTRAESDEFLDALLATLDADPDVVGLVLAGSSADWSRRDRWSDHDFLMVTVDGVQEHYRTDLSWLPDHQDIGWWFRETAHGLKVLYRSGLLLEFAVFDRAEFATCTLDRYRVALDRCAPGEPDVPSIAEVAAGVQGRSTAIPPVDPVSTLRHFLALVYVGTGRARRGERLSANVFLRDYATLALLRLLQSLDHGATSGSDRLDPWRRVEGTWPDVAAELDAALAGPVDGVGPALLDVAARALPARWAGWPAEDLDLVRGLLEHP